jgi:hypothetical protein
MKAILMAALSVTALSFAGTGAMANSVNGTDEYHPGVLMLPPACAQGTTEYTSECTWVRDDQQRMGQHENNVGSAHDQGQSQFQNPNTDQERRSTAP